MSTTASPVVVPPVTNFKVRIENYADETRVKIEGKGTVRIEGDFVVLCGRAPISLLPYPLCWRTLCKRIPLCEIINVVQAGTSISFDRVKDGNTWPRITLHASSQQEAAAMAALLPTQTTPEFVEQQKQQEAFASALNTATPTAFVTPIIIALNILVFVAMGIAGVGWFAPDPERMLSWGADFWPLTTSGQWWRLVTSTFLHFGVIHLALNMWALGGVGLLTERLFGNRFYAAIYLFGAITASLASNWWNQDAVGAGASGAIFAVYGALLAYLVFQPSSFPKGAVQPLIKSTLGFVAYNVFYGLGHAGISNAAHLGGLAGGILLGVFLCRPLDLARRSKQAVPRSVVAAIVGVATLGVSLYQLPKCSFDMNAERAFDAERQSFAGEADSANSTFNTMIERAKAGTLSNAEFAKRLDSEVIPKWEGMARRLSAITISEGSSSKPIHAALLRFCETRRDSFRALSEGLRTGDERKVKEYQSLADKAEQMIKDIEQMSKGRP